MHSVHPLHSPTAATADVYAAEAPTPELLQPTPPSRSSARRPPRPVSARDRVVWAKQVVGKTAWQSLDKTERVKLANEVAKFMSSPRAAKPGTSNDTPGSPAITPPGTPVGVKISRTVREMTPMRLEGQGLQRKKHQPHEAAMNRQIAVLAGRQGLKVMRSGGVRGEKSHTPPPRMDPAVRVAEVWQ